MNTSKDVARMLERAYAGGKTDPPAMGFDKAGEAIVQGIKNATEKIGKVAGHVYATIVSEAALSVSRGYAPIVVHFIVADRTTGLLAPGDRPVTVCQQLAAAGLLTQVSLKGKMAWIPSAMERNAPGKTGKTTDASPLVAALMSAAGVNPEAAQPEAEAEPKAKAKAKGRLVGRSLADLAGGKTTAE